MANYLSSKNIAFFQRFILVRGEDYFKEGRVKILKKSSDSVTSTVDGSTTYQVNLTFKDGVLSNAKCSCPYYSNFCKHAAAVLYELDFEEKENLLTTLSSPVSSKNFIDALHNIFSMSNVSLDKALYLSKNLFFKYHTFLSSIELSKILADYTFNLFKRFNSNYYQDITKNIFYIFNDVNPNNDTIKSFVNNLINTYPLVVSGIDYFLSKLLSDYTYNTLVEQELINEMDINNVTLFRHMSSILSNYPDSISENILDSYFTNYKSLIVFDKKIISFLMKRKYTNILVSYVTENNSYNNYFDILEIYNFLKTNNAKEAIAIGLSILKYPHSFSFYFNLRQLMKRDLTPEEIKKYHTYAIKNKYEDAFLLMEKKIISDNSLINISPSDLILIHKISPTYIKDIISKTMYNQLINSLENDIQDYKNYFLCLSKCDYQLFKEITENKLLKNKIKDDITLRRIYILSTFENNDTSNDYFIYQR